MNYLLSPQPPITQSRNCSLLRLPFFTVLLVLVGQLFIAGCGGSDRNAGGSVSLETPDLDTPPNITMAEAAPLPGDPTLIFDSPTDGADIHTAQDVMVKINASDNGGIQEVRLWSKEAADAAFTAHGIGVLKNGTYQWNLGKLAAGAYSLIAKATAMDGGSVIRWIAINVTAELPNVPTLTINSPADGAEALDSQDVMVKVSASDNSGLQDVLLWSKEAADAAFTPYGAGALNNGTYEWNLGKLAVGVYMINAKVFANDGEEMVTSITLNIIADGGVNLPPTLTFNSPADGADMLDNQDVMVNITASDEGGIDKVFLWSKSASDSTFTAQGAGTLNNGKYQWNLGRLNAGAYVLRAMAIANDGGQATGAIDINVTAVTGGGMAPTVYFVSPSNNLTRNTGYLLSVEAGASDDGEVTSVELLHNGNSVQILTAQPYNFSAIRLNVARIHTFELIATDDEGNTGTATLRVTINEPAGSGDLIVSPANGANFGAGTVTVKVNPPAGTDSVTFYLNGYKMESGTAATAVANELKCRNLQGGRYTVLAVAKDGAVETRDSITFTVTPARKRGQFNFTRLNGNKPVIGLETFEEVGATKRMYLQHYEHSDMNGPSCMRIPDWIPLERRADRTAKYYVYFAHHTGRYIRMAWAANIEGPYHLYNAGADIAFEDSGVLALQHYPDRRGEHEWSIDIDNHLRVYDHIASPVPRINNDTHQIEMYFHGKKATDGSGAEQVTFVAICDDGLDFNGKIEPVAIGHYYMVPWDWGGYRYAMENSGIVSRTYRPLAEYSPHEPTPGDNPYGETIWDRNFGRPMGAAGIEPAGAGQVRHTGPLVVGDTLYLFCSYMGDTPEQLYYVDFDMVADEKLKGNARYDIATAEAGWEGGQLKIEASGTGASRERVNQLRDPGPFVDLDGTIYLFYSGAGESEIGLGKLEWVD